MSPSDSAFRQSLHPAPAARRPLSIAELADRAVNNLWDPSRGLKQWLRAADGFRKAGRSYADAGDLEAAFVEFAKAATIILEKLPTHKEYYTVLTATQRHNLGLDMYSNGQAILENLGELKPVLVDRYERWASRNPEEAARARAALEQNVRQSIEERDTRHPAPDESGWQAQEAARLDSNRRREVERRRDEYRYRTVDSGASESPRRLQVDTRVRTKEDTSEQLTPEDTWTQEDRISSSTIQYQPTSNTRGWSLCPKPPALDDGRTTIRRSCPFTHAPGKPY
ncbi:hypothetical protein M404DRAFT_858831 [Pisolithus tinctorius Marx 270]|uniref:USP8 dimerisation domain-containing protein n=1 Tax=Pisolithus tinctorius Marx 270 TaxID=870435 RepID=A0A0C3NRL4_PISTI|nr:hypothetical protein M404DRAFT_858831 [Pisolithus tinctorius Marx 270]